MISINNLQKKHRIPKRQVHTWAMKILRSTRRSDFDLSISFVTDSAIKRLNCRFRGINRPTDVLSFPFSPTISKPTTGSPRLLGDVVISIERARSQSRRLGHALTIELQKLLIHGILHLCGYDHHSLRDARRMDRLEHRIAASLESA